MDAVTVEIQYLSALIGVIIPLLVGLLTKLEASPGVKAIANALLSAITGVVTQIIETGGTFIPSEAIVAVLLTWVVSVATYYGLWKPTHASEVVQLKTAKFGVSWTASKKPEAA